MILYEACFASTSRLGLLHRAPRLGQDFTIVVSMFEGRSIAAKKLLIAELYRTTSAIRPRTHDVELSITKTPRANWGIGVFPLTDSSSVTEGLGSPGGRSPTTRRPSR